MMFKRLSRDEVLEVLMMMASETIPEGIEGELSADLKEDGSAEIFFAPKRDPKELN